MSRTEDGIARRERRPFLNRSANVTFQTARAVSASSIAQFCREFQAQVDVAPSGSPEETEDWPREAADWPVSRPLPPLALPVASAEGPQGATTL